MECREYVKIAAKKETKNFILRINIKPENKIQNNIKEIKNL
jgi:hypothetical protein